nr:hypothetical protein [Mesorhizobium sp.]
MTALDPKVIEAAARELATEHYTFRFEKPADDPHVRANVDANWNVFVPALERHVSAYLTHAVATSAQTCATCRFYGTAQTCQRHAPIAAALPPGTSHWPNREWPTTSPSDWCGDHQAIEDNRPLRDCVFGPPPIGRTA